EKSWSSAVLRVLEKATRNRPEDRYQTVEEFWDDFADACLPPTRPLQQVITADVGPRRKPSEDLSVEPDEFTEAAPPRPHFAQPSVVRYTVGQMESIKRPRIVVPISFEARRQLELEEQEREREQEPARAKKASANTRKPPVGGPSDKRPPARPARRAVVALGLIMAFTGMLLATHKYVTSHWNPFVGLPLLADVFVIGREGVTTTDVRLRPDA